ncbi:MAG: hypothetical protein ACKO6N_06920 [Myxococcota bacterium]
MLKFVLGYPLFVIGMLSLGSGIALNSYWPMLLGLFSMAYGALNFTDLWG